MPAANKLTIAALLAITVSVAGCNSSKKASTASNDTAIPAAAASAAAAIQSAAAAASAPAGASAPAAAGAAAAGVGDCPLTGAQVTTVMGSTYKDPQNSNGICSYLGSSDAFTIQVLKDSGVTDFAATLATAVQDNGTDTTTAIPGLGDKATGVGLEIVVQSKGQIIDVRNADSPGFGKWPMSVALAKLVIAAQH